MTDTVKEINKQKNKTIFLSKLNKIVVVITFLLFIAVGTVTAFAVKKIHSSSEDYFAGIVEQTALNTEYEAKLLSLRKELKNEQNKLVDNDKNSKDVPMPDGGVSKDEVSTVNGDLMSENMFNDFSDIVSTQLSQYTGENEISGAVISVNGDYILKNNVIKSDFNNLFKENIKFLYTKPDDILTKLQDGKSGSFWFKDDEGIMLASFRPLKTNDSILLMVVPADKITLNADRTIWLTFLITGILSLVLAILLAYSEKQSGENDELMDKYFFTEPLTGGSNFADFEIEVSEILSEEYGGNFYFTALNIKNFRTINSLYGYEKGDEILKNIFDIISVNLPNESLCVKFNGSGFIIFYDAENSEDIAEQFVIKTKELIDKYNTEVIPNLNESRGSQIVAPIEPEFGIYRVSDFSVPVKQMCERAFAVLKTIEPGKFYAVYNEELNNDFLFEENIDKEMYSAIGENKFKMYLQPEFNIKTGSHTGAEALVRWHHSEKGNLLPGKFIPLFEKKGCIFELDKYMAECACKFLKDRKDNGKELFPISLNVSSITLNNRVFPETILLITQKYEIQPEYIKFEFSKDVYEQNNKTALYIAEKLKSYGFEVSVDGFGPGVGFDVSSVLNPQPYRINFLNEFISESIEDKNTRTLMAGLCTVARKLGIKTCAKNTETEELAKFAHAAGFDTVKGFLYGKPVPSEHYSSAFLNGK